MTHDHLTDEQLVLHVSHLAGVAQTALEHMGAALKNLADVHTAIAPAVAELAKRVLAQVPAAPSPEPEPEPVDPSPRPEPGPVLPPSMTESAPIKVPSAKGLPEYVIEDRIINMGIHTSGIELASPDFWPPKGPKTDQDWNRPLTVRRVTIYGGNPSAGKDWGMNVFGCKALTLEDVHIEGMLKEHGVYDHNPAGPTTLRRCSFKRNGGQGYQQTRRLWQQAGDNYEGPFNVPDAEDTFYAEECEFAENGLDGSRAAWAAGFYAGRRLMQFHDCTFQATAEAPKVDPKSRSGALCIKPEHNPDATIKYPELRHRTEASFYGCTFLSREDSPRETVLFGSMHGLLVANGTFGGTKVLIEDPRPDGMFTVEDCVGRLPIYVSRGYQQPAALVGYTDEGIDMTGAEMLALLPPEPQA